jgi:hypothetical protein
MTVINANEGTKIPYIVDGNKISFNDEICLNIEMKERDTDIHIDISYGDFRELITGVGRDYVAQIDIPARKYTQVDTGSGDGSEADSEINGTDASSEYVAVPFSMDNVTLTLFALREGVVENG